MVENGSTNLTRVLFCGPHWSASQNYTREYLQSYPFIQVDDIPLNDVPDVISKYHICVVKNFRMDSKVISHANQMKLIMQFGVGLDGVDIDAATNHGIRVARIPGDVTGNSTSCAEMAIYLMMGLLRRQKEMDLAVKQKRLGDPIGETLLGKTVFILGFGNIGLDLAKHLKPFGVRILATKRRWALDLEQSNDSTDGSQGSSIQSHESDELVDKRGGPDDIYDFSREADIVVTCLALNHDTVGIVDKKFISSMKKGSFLVNIARGGLLDYRAVADSIESGHLGGLGIDVAWTEPFDPDDPILKFPNVLITPHLAGVTEYSYRTMAKVVGDCAIQLHNGEPFNGIEFVN
ncbi:hypothetical protein QJS10_CPB19g00078 [Acorus calamus]|uniref:Uncharacterized protein n=1 Tax=Acorus calamus TaxID=4465 RepID=A0AAV9CI10_ACOCL|nr:hypothetical protein QJS10_CPB19g00078 [Acorus calamus]